MVTKLSIPTSAALLLAPLLHQRRGCEALALGSRRRQSTHLHTHNMEGNAMICHRTMCKAIRLSNTAFW